jgi:hemerythrin-like domain-containing protein
LRAFDPGQAANPALSKNAINCTGVVMSRSKTRTARPPRPAVPRSPAFEALDETHRQVMQTLGQLSRLLDHLDAQGADDSARVQARDICAFFDGAARAHHAAEEQYVFPPLLSSGDAQLVSHVQRLQQDHGWLEEDWLELAPQLKAVAEGYNWYDPDMLRTAIPIFAELYRDHIELEETIVYPASRGRQA